MRGGYGLFFTQVSNDGVQQTDSYRTIVRTEIDNDGRPDFAAHWLPGRGEWFNGPTLTFEQVLARSCDQNVVPGCLRRALTSEINHPWRRVSYSHQASIGVERQLGPDMSIEANYVYTGGRLEESAVNANLSYNPATGANYPFTDVSHRPFPDWGQVNFELLEGWSNYHAGDFTLTKRFSNRWQASGTYTLAYFRDARPFRDQWYLGDNGVVARRPIGFALAPDMGGEYGFAGAQGGEDSHKRATNVTGRP